MSTIGVGSTNPVKVAATQKAVAAYWNDKAIFGYNVESGISDMPLSKAEIRNGAKVRAQKVVGDEIWMGVGHEGGVCLINNIPYLFSATYITDGTRGSWGAETILQLPSQIYQQIISENKELGEIMDEITQKDNTKQKEGAVGYFTRNIVKREEIFYYATVTALAPWARSKDHT